MKYRTHLIVLVAAVAFFALGHVWRRPPVQEPPSATGDAALARLQQTVDALGAEVTRLRAERSVATPARPSPQPATDDRGIALPGADDEPPARESATEPTGRTRRDAVLNDLEERLAGEPLDAAWAGDAETEFAQGLETSGLTGTSLVSASCRSTLCRVTLTHRSPDDEDAFMAQLPNLPGANDTEMFYSRDENPDGTVSMVLYIARQGLGLNLGPAGEP